jgi:hypothetical protein
MVAEQHEHKIIKYGVKKITQVQFKYHGNAGDKAFLVGVCKCKHLDVLDYGNTNNMKELLKAKETDSTPNS